MKDKALLAVHLFAVGRDWFIQKSDNYPDTKLAVMLGFLRLIHFFVK